MEKHSSICHGTVFSFENKNQVECDNNRIIGIFDSTWNTWTLECVGELKGGRREGRNTTKC